MRIGYLENTYPYKRCIIDCIHENGVEYVQLQEKRENRLGIFARRVKNHLKYRLGISTDMDWNKEAIKRGKRYWNGQDVELVHTFNVLYRGKPWCCTFESQTPVTNDLIGRRWERNVQEFWKIGRTSRQMLRACAKPNCLALIAISQSAYNIQAEMIKRVAIPQCMKESMLEKLTVIQPPQEVLISSDELAAKYSEIRQIRLILVGHDFFRKGGMEVLQVLKELEKRFSFHLTIVSRLYYKDYASGANEEEYMHALQIIKESDWIDHYEVLDNAEVICKMKESHVGLLPTLADTYGYSALEMQACGCPVITTDIRALPEINNADCGWICHIPHNDFGEAIYGDDSQEKKRQIREILREELLKTLTGVLSHPEKIRKKAELSVRRIGELHDPAMISRLLQGVYQRNQAIRK